MTTPGIDAPRRIAPAVGALHVYPVKSLRGVSPGEAVVEPWGLAGDRRWMLIDVRTHKAVTQREDARLALLSAEPVGGDGVRVHAPGRQPLHLAVPPPGPLETVELFANKIEVLPVGGAADRWFEEFLDAPVRLVHMDDPAVRRTVDPRFARPEDRVSLADGFPLLVTTTASLAALNTLIAAGDRAEEGPLPMNRFRPNVVIDGTAAWEEDKWRRVRIGSVEFRVPKPCGRCVITTTDQRTGARGKEPLRTLARHRKLGAQLVFGQNLIPEHSGTLRVGDPFLVVE
ncbi:MOSC domain-containing protein [Actinacidiphila sp. ITFR-21]|uniref:MOSC domain-containing protein n=1 Tax=Actinacidiphila sp. ITFR-21 TaxID=3075199 RepID=UPI00288C2E41|nr:MOSC N-terminal beta barrel domain-containing protein [Streptomyces sp. ITFR-21]WNI19280.1 MOSC domain-containing protein [Streptomyces sp. ITFR-21]